MNLFNQPLSAVAVRALSHLQGDADRYRVFYRAWARNVFGVSIPLAAFRFVDAERACIRLAHDAMATRP